MEYRAASRLSQIPPDLVVKFGFDHGVGHPLLFMDDAKAHNC